MALFSGTTLKPGDAAPDFTLKDQDGKDVTLLEAPRQARRPLLLPEGRHGRLNDRGPGLP